MSDSVRPHRQQPTGLPCPWDSPGKNTGVGCHFLLQCTKVKSESEIAQSCPTLSDPMDCSLPGSSVHGIFPGNSTGVGCHCLLRHRDVPVSNSSIHHQLPMYQFQKALSHQGGSINLFFFSLSFRHSSNYSHPTRQFSQILVMYPSQSIHRLILCPLTHSSIPPSYHASI